MWHTLVEWWTVFPLATKAYMGFVLWGIMTVVMIRGLQVWGAKLEGDRVSVDPDD